MIKQDQAAQLIDGGSVVGSEGDSIGKIGQVYLDNQSGDVSWVTVKTGFFGSHESFVPTDDATIAGDTVTVPYDKDKIKGAPHFESGAELSPTDEDELYSYYGLGATARAGDYATEYAATGTKKRSGAPAKTSDKGYVTRSEEQLHVGTEKVQAGTARLRKFVVTEQQTVSVPVSHDEVHVVREPIQPGDKLDGATIGEDSIEVPLTAERAVVNKEVVGVEKVKLDTTTVTEQQQVTEGVRKEQIEVDGDTTGKTATTGTTTGTTAGKSLKDKATDKGRALLDNENR